MSGMSSLLTAPPSPPPPLPPLTSCSPPPSLTCCPELDLSVTFSPAPKTDHAHLRPAESSQRGNRTQPKPRPRGPAGKKSVKQVCFEEPVVVTVTVEPHVAHSRATEGLKKRSRKQNEVLKQSAPPSATTANQHPVCLERAELNTTLHLEAELQSVQGAEFNPQRALKQTLQREERTKNLINTRATEVVNIPRSQLLFTSLVSVDVEEDELISQVLLDKLLLAPPPRCHDNREAAAPSLLPFTTTQLLRQKPFPTEAEPLDCRPRPSPRPSHSTFDLHRRHTRWEATP